VPSEIPQDIYRTVAEKVVSMLEAVATTEPLALDWLQWGKVNRSFVKRQVMTLPYGSKRYGFREQIKEFIKNLEPEEQPTFMTTREDVTDGGFKHFQFIAGVIWDALAGTVTAATEGMEWLQSLARICAKEDLPICWTAPNGLPVVQGYREEVSKRITTTLVELRFDPSYVVATNALDHGKQVSGIAPNIIHSLDASAMMLTVVAAKQQGIDHFAMIHDSYGTHAADAPALARITREEFVRMYTENDVLTMLEEGLMANVDISKIEKYPARPATGSLDLAAVKDSRYFFS
jgi:DNA-directed RNA polymerase